MTTSKPHPVDTSVSICTLTKVASTWGASSRTSYTQTASPTSPSHHTPKLNRVAKRFNHTALTMVQAYLAKSSVKEELWGEALYTAIHVLNHMHNTTTMQTPFKHWFSKPATLIHVHVFSCQAFTLNHHNKHSKLGSQAHTATYLSPASKHNHTHQLLLNDTKKVIITCDIIFQE